MSPRARQRLAALAALALCGCVAPSGAAIQQQLVPGMTRDEALALLSERAYIESRGRIAVPASGNWEERVTDRALLGAILAASVRVDAPIAALERVRRDRILGADDFLLFFDANGGLLYAQRRPAR
ncbi:MAG TPA: hypothetical protein VIY27_05560 [Myxococcota bacterium]